MTRRERGSMSIFTVVFSVVVFLLAGMLVDGGSAINARLRAADIAEQGARAGADRVDIEYLRSSGQTRLLGQDQVCAKAIEVVHAYGEDGVKAGSCQVEQNQTAVTVEVSVHWDAFFLGAFGFPGSDMTSKATAGPDAR